MIFPHRTIGLVWLLLFSLAAHCAVYQGRVTDEKGEPIAYATVYPEIAPEWGTATNNDGFFSFEANLTRDMRVIVSYIGYEKESIIADWLLINGEKCKRVST